MLKNDSGNGGGEWSEDAEEDKIYGGDLSEAEIDDIVEKLEGRTRRLGFGYHNRRLSYTYEYEIERIEFTMQVWIGGAGPEVATKVLALVEAMRAEHPEAAFKLVQWTDGDKSDLRFEGEYDGGAGPAASNRCCVLS